MEKWEKHLGVKYPTCKKLGRCCDMATPSSPAVEMLRKASEGDSYARDFLSIFQPYDSIDDVRLKAPEFVDRALDLASRSNKFKSSDQVVFFSCRYLEGKNQCGVYEDRPQLCRDYPDTPFLLMHPGCAFESWALECKTRYKIINSELSELKKIKDVLTDINDNEFVNKPCYSVLIVSPYTSWFR